MNRLPDRVAWLLLAVGAIAIVAVAAATFLLLSGDDGGDRDVLAASPSGVEVQRAGGDEPLLDQPAEAYTVLHEELREPFDLNDESTIAFGPEGTSLVRYFRADEDRQALLGEWGFAGGYIVNFDPAGRLAAMMEGSHYLRFELYRFDDLDGAEQAWRHIAGVHLEREGIQPLDVEPVGNESLSLQLPSDPIPDTDSRAVIERTLFRRGNLVAIAETVGAEDLIQDGLSRHYAAGIDLKATGEVDPVAPTPIGGMPDGGPAVDPDTAPSFEITPEGED